MRTLVLFFVTAVAVHAQSAWPTPEWRVACLPALEAEYLAGGETQACDLQIPDLYRGQLEQTVREIAGRLAAVGYRSPALRQADGRYLAVFTADHASYICQGRQGCYILADGGGVATDPRTGEEIEVLDRLLYLPYLSNQRLSVAHELFHAVQAAYLPPSVFDGSGQGTNGMGWITEGTAEAIGILLSSEQPVARSYSQPLHRPGSVLGEYRTAEFWLFVARRMRGLGALSAFEPLLARLEGGADGLDEVDAVLRDTEPGGLPGTFRAFIAQEADTPAFFDAVRQAHVRGALPIEETVSGSVRAMAADATALTVTVPAGATSARLSIELDTAEDLALVVDGEVVESGVFGRPVGPGEHDLFVRVVNAAETPSASRDQTYTLRVAVTEPAGCDSGFGAAFAVSGDGPAVGGGRSRAFPLRPTTVEGFGGTSVAYHGLTVVRRRDSRSFVWNEATEREHREDAERSRRMMEELGLVGKSPAEIRRAIGQLDRATLARYFPEEDEPDGPVTIGDVLGAGFSATVPEAGAIEMAAISFFDPAQGVNVTIQVLFTGQPVGPGVYTEQTNVGLRAPVLLSGSERLTDGVLLYQPTVTFTELDPSGCVPGSFSGVYAGPDGQPHTASGTFRIVIPPDAAVADLR